MTYLFYRTMLGMLSTSSDEGRCGIRVIKRAYHLGSITPHLISSYCYVNNYSEFDFGEPTGSMALLNSSVPTAQLANKGVKLK